MVIFGVGVGILRCTQKADLDTLHETSKEERSDHDNDEAGVQLQTVVLFGKALIPVWAFERKFDHEREGNRAANHAAPADEKYLWQVERLFPEANPKGVECEEHANKSASDNDHNHPANELKAPVAWNCRVECDADVGVDSCFASFA